MSESNENPIGAFYKLLQLHGLDAPQVPVALPSGERLGLGWESAKVAVSGGTPAEEDTIKAFENNGWVVHKLSLETIRAALPLLVSIQELSVLVRIEASAISAKLTTSKPEQALLRGFVEQGLPVPERNAKFVIEDSQGQLDSTPDFYWPEAKLIVELDGWWFHNGQGDDEMLRLATEGGERKAVLAAKKRRDVKDNRKRRWYQANGFEVMAISDQELDSYPMLAAEVADRYVARKAELDRR